MTPFESLPHSQPITGEPDLREELPSSLIHGSQHMVRVFERLSFQSAARWGDALGQLVLEVSPLPSDAQPAAEL